MLSEQKYYDLLKEMESLIIEQLKTGNEKAYEYIYKHHYAFLCHIAYGYVNDHFLAETLVGDVIFHLWEKRETLNISTSIRSYLIVAVRNKCLDHLSSLKERTEISFSNISPDESITEKYILSDNYPLGRLLEKELEHEIYSAIRSLPKECRNVFIKNRFENKTYNEIANELNISPNTVKYHIRNALASLHEKLSKYLVALCGIIEYWL